MPASVQRPSIDRGVSDAEDTDDFEDEDGDDASVTDVGEIRVRQCSEPGCTTVLSRYNATAYCGVHHRRDWRATREPRRRSA